VDFSVLVGTGLGGRREDLRASLGIVGVTCSGDSSGLAEVSSSAGKRTSFPMMIKREDENLLFWSFFY
jgi:hypothetical protein